MLEVNTGWCFESSHIPGSSNVLADGITRWGRADIPQKLTELSPTYDILWQEASLGESGGKACSAILRPFSQASELRRRLTRLMPQIENVGRVAADGGEKRGVCGHVSRARSSGSRNREV